MRYTKLRIYYSVYGEEHVKTLPLSKKTQKYGDEHGYDRLNLWFHFTLEGYKVEISYQGTVLQDTKICDYMSLKSHRWLE